MKTFLLALSLSCCTSAWASYRVSCQMVSNGNQSLVTIITDRAGAAVSFADDSSESCVSESSTSYSVLVRCGEGEDATYFGVKGKSGRVFNNEGKIADLKDCR